MPGTTSWMTVTPNEGLARKIESTGYRCLMKWWLGRPLVHQECRTCPCCEGPMDLHGDHLVSCSFNQPQLRHNALRDALAETLKAHKVQVRLEVPIGGARRPADLALEHFDPRGPLAIDLVIHHPLALSENRSADLARTSLANAESKQHSQRRPRSGNSEPMSKNKQGCPKGKPSRGKEGRHTMDRMIGGQGKALCTE